MPSCRRQENPALRVSEQVGIKKRPDGIYVVPLTAANMIGVARRIIIFDDNGTASVMFNPEIIKSSGPYEAEEGCLSLAGTRKAKRYRSIKVQYQNERFESNDSPVFQKPL